MHAYIQYKYHFDGYLEYLETKFSSAKLNSKNFNTKQAAKKLTSILIKMQIELIYNLIFWKYEQSK